MNLNQITPAIFVKNLRRRQDRLEHITQQMEKIGTAYYVFDVADHRGTQKSAQWWNAHNALQMIRYAKAAELDSIMNVDDDCFFVDNFNTRLTELWPHMPSDWDMVSFGEIFSDKTQVYPGIVRTNRSWGGHATIIRHTVYDALLEHITGDNWMDEEVNLKLKPHIKYYAFFPYLVTQIEGYSDLKDSHQMNRMFE